MSAPTPKKKFQSPRKIPTPPDWEGILMKKRFWGCLRASILLIFYNKKWTLPQIDYKVINSISKVLKLLLYIDSTIFEQWFHDARRSWFMKECKFIPIFKVQVDPDFLNASGAYFVDYWFCRSFIIGLFKGGGGTMGIFLWNLISR